jgi:hypothetical protein
MRVHEGAQRLWEFANTRIREEPTLEEARDGVALARPLQIGRRLRPDHNTNVKTDLNAADDGAARCVGVDIKPVTGTCSEESARWKFSRTVLNDRVAEERGSDELVVKKGRIGVLLGWCRSLEEGELVVHVSRMWTDVRDGPLRVGEEGEVYIQLSADRSLKTPIYRPFCRALWVRVGP